MEGKVPSTSLPLLIPLTPVTQLQSTQLLNAFECTKHTLTPGHLHWLLARKSPSPGVSAYHFPTSPNLGSRAQLRKVSLSHPSKRGPTSFWCLAEGLGEEPKFRVKSWEG